MQAAILFILVVQVEFEAHSLLSSLFCFSGPEYNFHFLVQRTRDCLPPFQRGFITRSGHTQQKGSEIALSLNKLKTN